MLHIVEDTSEELEVSAATLAALDAVELVAVEVTLSVRDLAAILTSAEDTLKTHPNSTCSFPLKSVILSETNIYLSISVATADDLKSK